MLSPKTYIDKIHYSLASKLPDCCMNKNIFTTYKLSEHEGILYKI